MNDIFKIFKKRAQSGKSTNITDVIKDLNENEKDEIGKFDRGNKSYLSISKSGRLKSKKACQNNSRILNDDLFNPARSSIDTSAVTNSKPIESTMRRSNNYDQHSDNADSSIASSASSSFRSSCEDFNPSLTQSHNNPYNHTAYSNMRPTTYNAYTKNSAYNTSNNTRNNANTNSSSFNYSIGFQKKL